MVKLPPQEVRRLFQFTRFDGLPDERGADRFPFHDDRWQPDDREIQPFAQPREQIQVALAPASERPVEPHANLAQRTCGLTEVRDERFRRRRGEPGCEGQREAMCRAEFREELELVARARQQTRRAVRPQHAQGVRIEGDDNRRRTRLALGVRHRAADDRLMAQMHAVEHADGQISRAEIGQRVGRMVEFQAGLCSVSPDRGNSRT